MQISANGNYRNVPMQQRFGMSPPRSRSSSVEPDIKSYLRNTFITPDILRPSLLEPQMADGTTIQTLQKAGFRNISSKALTKEVDRIVSEHPTP